MLSHYGSLWICGIGHLSISCQPLQGFLLGSLDGKPGKNTCGQCSQAAPGGLLVWEAGVPAFSIDGRVGWVQSRWMHRMTSQGVQWFSHGASESQPLHLRTLGWLTWDQCRQKCHTWSVGIIPRLWQVQKEQSGLPYTGCVPNIFHQRLRKVNSLPSRRTHKSYSKVHAFKVHIQIHVLIFASTWALTDSCR